MPIRIVATNMRRFAVVLWVVAVVLVVVGLTTDGSRALLLVPAPSLFTAWFAYIVLWRPRIELTEDALVVVDVRRTTRFAWRRVREIRTRYGLEVITDQGEQRVWIAPRATARLTIDRPATTAPAPASDQRRRDAHRAPTAGDTEPVRSDAEPVRNGAGPVRNGAEPDRNGAGSARGGTMPVSVEDAAAAMRTFVPAPATDAGPPPTTVVAAPIVHRVHGWAVVALIVLGIAGSMAGARL